MPRQRKEKLLEMLLCIEGDLDGGAAYSRLPAAKLQENAFLPPAVSLHAGRKMGR